MIAGAVAFAKLAWSWINTPLGRGVAALAAVGLALWLVHGHGVGEGVSREKVAQAKREEVARKAVAKREAKAEQITATVAADLVRETVRVQTVTRTIIEKVPVYVTAQADDRCIVPVGFVQLHDAAAASSIPAAPGGPVEADSGVPLSAVAGTVASNYGVAREWEAEVRAWRAWYREQAGAWGKPLPD